MSILYLDTSALAKRYLTESGWTWIQSLIDSSAGNTILAAEITRVEVAAALSARHRATDGISQTERDNAVRLLVHHCNIEYMMIPVDTTVLDRALTLTQNHRLRGYDAVQLATALVVNEQYLAAELPALTFVTADADLVAAGDAEGLVTDDPNRYGEPGDQLSEDWARTLAHELGHYLFFLHDNYVGLDNDNRVVRVKSCLGVMQNPYGETNSEFHPQTDWLPNCEETFSHRKLGRHDWATIKAHYPWLHEPSVPTFSLTKSDGQRYLASSSARAFLFQGDQLIDLGAPRNDRVEARDAHPGDTLCVYDLAAKDPDGLITPLTRCVTIQTGDEELSLEMPPGGWQPELIITPRAPRP